jgi:sugar fermentation stimulation protein A
MQLNEKLIPATLLKRYKRFFADVRLDGGETLTVHVPNTGSLKTCLEPGQDCWIALSTDPKRKLKGTLHFVQTPMGWAGIHTGLANQLAHEAWATKVIADWKGFTHAAREPKISASTRFDLALATSAEDLDQGRGLHYVEVKSVTYCTPEGTAQFPDAVTQRGLKHLHELARITEEGRHTTELVFVVQREGATQFAPAVEIDPAYAKALSVAASAGVKIRVLQATRPSLQTIVLDGRELPLTF